jgi:hypothetical protein
VQPKDFSKKNYECANLHTSFETDWFSAMLSLRGPDLDLAAKSFSWKQGKKQNGTGNSKVVQ